MAIFDPFLTPFWSHFGLQEAKKPRFRPHDLAGAKIGGFPAGTPFLASKWPPRASQGLPGPLGPLKPP